MIISCPNCETKFELPDDKYRPGRKARCSNCGFVFALPGAGETVGPAAVQAEAVPDIADDFPDPLPEGEGLPDFPDAGDGEPPEPEGLPGEDVDAVPGFPDGPVQEETPLPASLDDVVPPPAGAVAVKKRSKKRLLLLLSLILALALLAYGGVMVYSAFFAPAKSPDVSDGGAAGTEASAEKQEEEAARRAAVRHLSLENVRQYTETDNERAGPMVVIEGTVVNNFDTPKDLILLEITLFDDKGEPRVIREQYCGVTLSQLQLRTLSKAAIESALENEVVIFTNNTDIPPGGRVPFTTVFFDVPKSAYEFEVKIADVKDSAAKK